MSPQPLVSGGTVSATGDITVKSIIFDGDGGFNIVLLVTLNGATRHRVHKFAADGASSSLDGVPISNPPAAVVNEGSGLVTVLGQLNTVYGLPAIQALLFAT